MAGTSAGAITACLTSFNLSFDDLKEIADSLDYNKVPGKDDVSVDSKSPLGILHNQSNHTWIIFLVMLSVFIDSLHSLVGILLVIFMNG